MLLKCAVTSFTVTAVVVKIYRFLQGFVISSNKIAAGGVKISNVCFLLGSVSSMCECNFLSYNLFFTLSFLEKTRLLLKNMFCFLGVLYQGF